MADATWQAVLASELTEQGAGRLADVAVAALEREMPLLRADGDLRDLARSSTVANLLLVADIAAGAVALAEAAPPSQSVAFARELARRNVPMSELARTYRVVQHEMWRVGVARIRERIADPDAVAAAVESLTDATFATGEVLMSTALERYSAERDRWVRSADAVRRETVEAVLDGGPVDADAASARLRYDLRREHLGFVVWSTGNDAESAAAAIGGPGALLIPLRAGVTAGWCHPDALDDAALAAAPHVALGTPGAGIDGFRSTHREAIEAERVGRLASLDGPVRYADVALTALLTNDLPQARAFAARELGGLAGDDGRIAETILAVLETQGSPRHAAQRLGVHENTVAKRVKAAEALLGHPIDERPAELHAALLIARAGG
jgi:DNA-binding PucR family transcriptional regulator